MNANPPGRFVVVCSVDDRPLSGAYAMLRIPMWSKNQYHVVVGPSDDAGVIEIEGEELQRRTLDELAMFPMDYVSFPEEWSGGAGVEIIDKGSIARLRQALAVWGPSDEPLGSAAALDSYERYLSTFGGRSLTADIARSE